ncbi:hypothetical protein J1N35_015578 [Gossypium stocksii]|uniref:BHLH domain-containing protein n=1 Tax=Gossypium stocksii TaxID=47602 RepID=A0A9D3VWN4_9ROSI|nr:hypothetical protein J1N35_015578 [Gossypium stocksii]
MKMEEYDFCSTLHPLHSYAPSPFTSSVHNTEFNNMMINSHEPKLFNDPNLQSLLPLPYEPDGPCCFFTPDPDPDPIFPSLPLPDLDFSLFSSDIPDPATLPLLNLPSPPLFLSDLRPLHRLPPLSSSSPPKSKRTRLDLVLPHSDNNPQTLDSIVKSFNAPPPPPIIPHSELARKRRQKRSEKTRCLQKLMPWDKKMDMATMLQEAYKYIRFLQAQVSILQSMPITSSFVSTTQRLNNASFEVDFAGLGRLNRQQLLQVLINSPVAQTMLCSQGLCVFATEQLVSLNKAKERKTMLQQFLIGRESDRLSEIAFVCACDEY